MKTIFFTTGILLVATLVGAQSNRLSVAPGTPMVLTATATNDLSSTLQRGLFEEEGNRDYRAAISAYESLIAEFDRNRETAATAIFRSGECYRKLGRTNEAVAQYERVVREFSDQQTLVTVSRQNIAGLAGTVKTPLRAPVGDSSPLGNLKAQYVFLKTKLDEARKTTNNAIVAQLFSDAKSLVEQWRLASSVIPSYQSILLEAKSEGSVERIREAEKHLRDGEQRVAALRQQILDYEELQLKALQSALAQAGADPLVKDSMVDANENPSVIDEEDKEIRRLQKMTQDSPDLINATSESEGGLTPLDHAAYSGWLHVAEFLLDHGATLDKAALLHATFSGHRTMVEFLLAHGADIEAQDSAGYTALYQAADKGYLTIAQILIQHGANLNAHNSLRNGSQTPLQRAIMRGHAAVATLLIAKGADVNALDNMGNSAVWYAVSYGHVELLRQLLQAGAKPDEADKLGRTPLSYATAGANAEMMKTLIAAGADTNHMTRELPASVPGAMALPPK